MDFEGFFYFKGKKDDFILVGGEHIFARDIENVANSHPHIVETAVVSELNGTNSRKDSIITVVKVKEKAITHQEFSDFLYHNLAYYHVPRFIEFRDKIPKGPSTEILKSVLKKEWNENRSKNSIWDTQIKDFLK